MLAVRSLSVRVATLLAVAAAAGTLIFDLSQPLGLAAGIPYIALPLLGLLARSTVLVIALAVAGTALTGIGLTFSPVGADYTTALANRTMSAVLVWIVALIALRHLYLGNSLKRRLQEQAMTDPLTGLYNRRHVFARLESELRRYKRYGDRLSVILIDADHFKAVNDTHGHAAGDRTLKRIADICRSEVRETDVVGRFGGEEFIVLLPQTDAASAAVVAERIRKAMHDDAAHTDAVHVTLSLGVAEVGPQASTFDTLLKLADEALYAAKRAGRDRVATSSRQKPTPRVVDAA